MQGRAIRIFSLEKEMREKADGPVVRQWGCGGAKKSKMWKMGCLSVRGCAVLRLEERQVQMFCVGF